MSDRPSARLRILVITNLYPSAAHPAFGTFVGGRVEALRRAGTRVSVAAITDDRAHHGIGRKYLRLASRALADAVIARLRGRPYDIVEAHIAFPTGLVAWPAARLGGSKLVLFCHGSDVTRLPWLSPRRAAAARWLFARADLVIANSAYIADIVARRLGPLRASVEVVSPGIDSNPMQTVAQAVERETDQVLFVGRLAPGKGVEVLIEAVERLAARSFPVRLTIVGDGECRDRLEAKSHASDTPVTFVGPLAPVAVRQLMATSAVVVVPSTMPEGLGLVAIEAMASGALVVATRMGGLAETMRDGENGFVVPPGDVAALTNALERALVSARSADGERIRADGARTAGGHDRARAVRLSLAHYTRMLAFDG